MTQSLTDMLTASGLAWKPESLEYISSTTKSFGELEVKAKGVRLPVPPKSHLETLGVVLEKAGDTKNMADHRLSKAHAKFMMNRNLLLNKLISLRIRFEKHNTIIVKSAIFGSGGWTWTASLYHNLKAWESRRLRWIVGSGRKPDETYIAHIRRATRNARELYYKY